MGNNNDTKHINDSMNSNVAEKATVTTKEEAFKKLSLDDQTAILRQIRLLATHILYLDV